MKKILLVFAIFSFGHLFSQDWSLLCSDRQQRYSGLDFPFGWYYSPYSNSGFTLKYDSIGTLSGDSVFYGYRMMSFLDTAFCSPLASFNPSISFNPASLRRVSWLGLSAIKKSNGAHQFINRYGDTLTFNPYLAINQSDTLIKLNTNNFLVYRLDSINFIQHYAITDSIKVFTLLMKDSMNQIIPHPLNHKKIRISKNFGAITLPKFFDFPADTNFVQWQGDNLLKIGVYQLGVTEIFDYQPGDIFHYKSGTSGAFVPTVATYQIDSVKQRIDSANKVNYLISRTIANTNFNNVVTNVTRIDSMWLGYVFTQPNFTTIAEREFILISSGNGRVGHEPGIGSWSFNGVSSPQAVHRIGFTELGLLDSAAFASFSCFYEYLDFSHPTYTYAKGLGFIDRYQVNGVFGTFYTYTSLTFADKGCIIYGSPHDSNLFLSIEDDGIEKLDLSIYPNPNKGSFTLNAPIGQLTILDQLGRTVANLVHNSSVQNHQVTHLPPGIYLYQFTTQDGIHSFGKLQIEQ